MIAPLLLLTVAASAPAPAPEAPRGGVQAVALATVEIVSAARATIDPGPHEPHRQVRRNGTGQTLIEFE
jgi:hypothetical protein